jgi:D-alanine transaminase/branched-chain amino acid aminotransferase
MLKYILNDKIIDEDKAFVHVSDLTLLRGYGVFDFFRLVDLQPLYLEDHLARFFRSADILRLKCPLGRKRLKLLISDMISANQIRNSGVRIVLTGGPSETGYSIGKPTLFVINEPISALPKDHFVKGIKLISYEYQRDLPEVKSINYLTGIYKQPDIKKHDAMDLLYHWEGKISELTRSNFFIIDKAGKIATAQSGVLKGINRKHVIAMAKKHHEVEERDIYIGELSEAQEAFITGTTKKVMPVYQVDDVMIGDEQPGPVTRRLQELYDAYIENFLQQH